MITESQIQEFQPAYEKETKEKISLEEPSIHAESMSKRIRRIHIPLVDYQFFENENGSLENAFDILFEETLRQNGKLTSSDN